MWLVGILMEEAYMWRLPTALKREGAAGVCFMYDNEEDAIKAAAITSPPAEVIRMYIK